MTRTVTQVGLAAESVNQLLVIRQSAVTNPLVTVGRFHETVSSMDKALVVTL